MSNLKEALADARELFTDMQYIPHPITDAHVLETRRRAVGIGASCVGEYRNKYDAFIEVGMKAVAAVQKRNAHEELHPNGFIGVAGVVASTPRWQDRIESLEYAVGSMGLDFKRSGDDSVIVSPRSRIHASASEVPAGLISRACYSKPEHKVILSASGKRACQSATAHTYLESVFSGDGSLVLSCDDMQLLVDCLGADSRSRVLASVLDCLGIQVAES